MSQQECCAGFTKTVGLEMALKGNITCNAICPGYVLTDLIRNQLEDTAKARGISKVLPYNAQARRQGDLAYYMHSLNFWCGSRRVHNQPSHWLSEPLECCACILTASYVHTGGGDQ